MVRGWEILTCCYMWFLLSIDVRRIFSFTSVSRSCDFVSGKNTFMNEEENIIPLVERLYKRIPKQLMSNEYLHNLIYYEIRHVWRLKTRNGWRLKHFSFYFVNFSACCHHHCNIVRNNDPLQHCQKQWPIYQLLEIIDHFSWSCNARMFFSCEEMCYNLWLDGAMHLPNNVTYVILWF